jgi:hypothetical protein
MSHLLLCTASAAALAVGLAAAPACAAVKTRQFTFENGTVGQPGSTLATSITGPFKDVPDATFGLPTDFLDSGGNAIPGGIGLDDWLEQSYDPTPDFTSTGTHPTYVNVANGSPLDSPVPNSNVAIQFGAAGQFVSGQGFRGTYVSDEGVASNAPSVDGTNTFTSFTVLSQAWVRPDPAGQGTAQALWALGTDLGSPRITDDGFWELANVNVIANKKSTRAVQFGAWTHVAILRTGGAATLYINGSVAAAGPGPGENGFFGAFPTETYLGSSLAGVDPYQGLIDNFALSGIGGLGFSVSGDIDYFSDLNLPVPSGVAGDVNQDGVVNQTDYEIWSTNTGFDNTFGLGDLTTLVKGDLDNNGKIDFYDFRIIARQATAGGVTLNIGVPEPASGVMIAVVAAVGLAYRRRFPRSLSR